MVCVCHSLTIHLLKDIWAVSSFWLLWGKLLWTFVYRFLCEHKFSFLWDRCLRLKLLGRMVIAWLVLKETAKPFSRVAVPIYTPPAKYEWSSFSASSPALGGGLIFTALIGMKWDPIRFNFQFSDNEWCWTSSCALLPLIDSLRWNVCSCLLPIFLIEF